MFRMQLLRALVTERLAAAAEEISTAVEGMITEERTLSTTERSPQLQKAVIQKQLEVVADELFRIIQTLMGDIKADVSGSHEEIGHHRELLDITLKTETKLHRTERLPGSDCEKDVTSKLLKCEWSRSSSQVEEESHLPLINDVSVETNSELIHTKASHFCQTQRAEKGALTVMETETQGRERVLPGSDQDALSSNNSEAESEDSDDSDAEQKGKTLKSNKRKGFQRQSQGKKTKIKKHTMKCTPTSKIQTTGQSCCRVCGKVFRYKRSFLKHVLQHEQSSDLCGACGKHLGSGECLTVHLQSHNEENICRDDRQSKAVCSDAESKVGNSDEDRKDIEGADSGDGEKDEICSQNPSKVKNQGSNKPKGPNGKDVSHKYRCKVCCKSFCYRASFLKHVQEDESDIDVCGVCGERFESKDSLRLHLQTYIQKNDCEVCGKHFDGHKQLDMHMRVHTGEKPYICAVCGKAFSQNGNLMGHMRVHTGERPYACRVCRQAFSFKEYMMAHMRIHTGEKPFLCSVCGKGFRQRGTLKTHMMIHTGESTHQCSICDKKFYKSGALKIHMRSHTGEKPYLCNVCGKSFTASGSLSKHMGIHEGR